MMWRGRKTSSEKIYDVGYVMSFWHQQWAGISVSCLERLKCSLCPYIQITIPGLLHNLTKCAWTVSHWTASQIHTILFPIVGKGIAADTQISNTGPTLAPLLNCGILCDHSNHNNYYKFITSVRCTYTHLCDVCNKSWEYPCNSVIYHTHHRCMVTLQFCNDAF